MIETSEHTEKRFVFTKSVNAYRVEMDMCIRRDKLHFTSMAWSSSLELLYTGNTARNDSRTICGLGNFSCSNKLTLNTVSPPTWV